MFHNGLMTKIIKDFTTKFKSKILIDTILEFYDRSDKIGDHVAMVYFTKYLQAVFRSHKLKHDTPGIRVSLLIECPYFSSQASRK